MPTTVIATSDQKEIRSVARRFLETHYANAQLRTMVADGSAGDGGGWKAITDLGWPGIDLPEERGGAGYGMSELCILLEETGRVLLPEPLLSSGVLALGILVAAESESAEELLSAVLDGTTRATLVGGSGLLPESTREESSLVVRTEGDTDLVTGSAGLVLDGDTADKFLLVATLPDGQPALFAIDGDAGAVLRTSTTMVDRTRRFAKVSFEEAHAIRLDGRLSPERSAAAGHRGTIALAAEMVGGAMRCLEITIEYLSERHQFGVPIGSFQALKHRVADLFVELEAARELVYLAADTIDNGDLEGVPAVASAAQAAASDAYLRISKEAIQLHGGIGFTAEANPHLYYKRALVSSMLFGSAVTLRMRIARELDV
jgi:alkylation response protein AidB-like acyl-CoA dehydrogenase